MGEKVFKTYDEQLDILAERGLVFADRNARRKAKYIIQREGYYKVINGYKAPFLKPDTETETYLEGCTIDEIFALYCFDRELREIFMRHILHVEINMKSLISYVISEKYGHENYLLYRNFNTAKKDANKEIPDVIANLQDAIAKSSSDPCIQHYLQNYGYVPMWVLNNVLTLGNVSRLYSVMKTEDRQKISRKFKLPDVSLENLVFRLSIVRNYCAHGNRLYCMRTKRPLVDMHIHTNLSIKRNAANEYVLGKRDLFSAVIALRYLLSAKEFGRFQQELNGAINKLEKKLNVIEKDVILSMMGFPDNWKDIKIKGMKFAKKDEDETVSGVKTFTSKL